MGHVLIQDVRKEYINRRRSRRNEDEPNVGPGDKVLVLNDINLEFLDGEMVCLLGPSGCGKSTLLRIIAGFDRKFKGNVQINGHDVKGPSAEHIFLFQHSALLPWMTVGQNVELGLRHMKDKQAVREQILENIEMVGLEGFEDHYPHQLSGGMQRRAELARALAVNPDILFMDEPLTGLDFLTHMRMREEIVNVHEYFGKTIIFVTHDIDDALIMADRIVVFSERPTKVNLERKLEFPRPRDFETNHELSKLRDEVFFMLGVHYAV